MFKNWQDYYRSRFRFLSIKLKEHASDFWKIYGGVFEDFYHDNEWPFLSANLTNADWYAQEAPEKEFQAYSLGTADEQSRTAWWIDHFLSYVWHRTPAFKEQKVETKIFSKGTLLYHISFHKFRTNDLPNQNANYFMIDDESFQQNKEMVAGYQLTKTRERKETPLTLWLNVFEVNECVRLICLHPSFNVSDAIKYYNVPTSNIVSSDTLNDFICSKALESLKNVSGIYMFGHFPSGRMREIVICGSKMSKIKFIRADVY